MSLLLLTTLQHLFCSFPLPSSNRSSLLSTSACLLSSLLFLEASSINQALLKMVHKDHVQMNVFCLHRVLVTVSFRLWGKERRKPVLSNRNTATVPDSSTEQTQLCPCLGRCSLSKLGKGQRPPAAGAPSY